MAEFKGSDGDLFRIKILSAQREQQRKAFEESLAKLEEQTKKGVMPMEERFTSREEVRKTEIVGLVSLDEFKRKKSEMNNEISTNTSGRKINQRKVETTGDGT